MLFLSQSLRRYCHAIIHKTEFSCQNERCGYIFLQQESKTLKLHRHYLNGRLLCSLRTNRKWCKRKGRSLRIQICFFVYTISDSILKNLVLTCPSIICFRMYSEIDMSACSAEFSIIENSVSVRRIVIRCSRFISDSFCGLVIGCSFLHIGSA